MSGTNAEFKFRIGADLPALKLPWLDQDGNPIDFTTGYTFTLTLALTTATTSALVKTSGILGYDGGVEIHWDPGDEDEDPPVPGELDLIPAGTYRVWLRARRTADKLDRDYPPPDLFIEITAGPPPAP